MNLQLFVLQILRQVAPLLVPETQIRNELRLTITPTPTGTEMSEALTYLDEHRLAIAIRDDITKAVRWRITDDGKATLAARGL
jgi:hypothetical protein